MRTPILLKLIKGFPSVWAVPVLGSIKIIFSIFVPGRGGRTEETHAYSETFTKGYISFHLGVRGVPPRDISSGWLYCQLQFNVITVLKRKLDHFIRWIMFSSACEASALLASSRAWNHFLKVVGSESLLHQELLNIMGIMEKCRTWAGSGGDTSSLLSTPPAFLSPDTWYKCVSGPLGSGHSPEAWWWLAVSSELISSARSGAA